MSDIWHTDYDSIAAAYAANRDFSRTVVSHIIESLHGNHRRDILEAGCGTADHLWARKEDRCYH